MPDNADRLVHFGMLPTAPAAGKGNACYRDPYGCNEASWNKDEIVRRRRAQARQQIKDAEHKHAQKQLKDITKARFEAIQKEAEIRK